MERCQGKWLSAFDSVPPHNQTTGAMALIVAAVDENADEVWHIVEVWELPFEPGAVLHRYLVGPGWDGGLGIDLLLTGTRDASRSVRAGGRQVTDCIFDSVASVHPVDVKFSDGVTVALEDAFDK